MDPLGAEANSPRLSRDPGVGEIDIIAADGQVDPGCLAEGDIATAAGIVKERLYPDSRVLRATGVAIKGAESLGSVIMAGSVVKERLKTNSGVVDPAGQAKKRRCSLSGVVARIAAVRRRAGRLRYLAKRKVG